MKLLNPGAPLNVSIKLLLKSYCLPLPYNVSAYSVFLSATRRLRCRLGIYRSSFTSTKPNYPRGVIWQCLLYNVDELPAPEKLGRTKVRK